MTSQDHAAHLSFLANNLARIDAIAADLGARDTVKLLTEWLEQRQGKGSTAADLIAATIQAVEAGEGEDALNEVGDLHQFVTDHETHIEGVWAEWSSGDPYDAKCDDMRAAK